MVNGFVFASAGFVFLIVILLNSDSRFCTLWSPKYAKTTWTTHGEAPDGSSGSHFGPLTSVCLNYGRELLGKQSY